MKRDMDLIRKILFEIEKFEEYHYSNPISIEGYSDGITSYHILILHEAGLIVARDNWHEIWKSYYSPIRLTWEGHEFIDLVREDTIWKEAKRIMANTGGMAFEILLKVLMDYLKRLAIP